MPLESIYFLPHGGAIVPELEQLNDEGRKLNKAMHEVAQEIKDDEIHIIFMTSPHGYVVNNSYMVYFHSLFESWEILGNPENLDEKRVERRMWQGNIEAARVLYQFLEDSELNVTPLILGDPNYPFKLAWGETIPLSFIGHERVNVVIFSVPMERKENTFEELKEVGKTLSKMFRTDIFSKVNVSLVISGDLSHKHDPDHHYGYHDDAKTFDENATKWFSDSSNGIFQKLIDQEETAAPCGLLGMTILQGLFEVENNWQNRKNVYGCPTYFGMNVSSWKKRV